MSRIPFRRSLAVFAVVLVAAEAVPCACAQGQQLAPLADLNKARIDKFARIAQMKTGNGAPVGAGDKEAIDIEARFLVYRFTATPQDMPTFQRDVRQFVDLVMSTENDKKNEAFRKQFGPALAKSIRDVFDLPFADNRYAITNLAHMLPVFARMKDDKFGEYMVEILTDYGEEKGKALNKHDLIKMYAARALREYFPVNCISPDEENLGPNTARRKAHELLYVDALAKFIERPGMDKLADDEKAAMHFIRREVIETLAGAKAPSIVAGTAKIEGPIAPTLLKVLAPKSGLDLKPQLPEKLEAAIGICNMNLKNSGEYQPELGLHLVAMFVHEFAVEYNKDFAIFGEKDAAPKARMEWRIQSRRLEEALKEMSKNVKGQPIATEAKRLEDYATETFLRPMQGKKQTQITQGTLEPFRNEAMKLRPKNTQVYKTVKDYVITLE